MKIEYGKSIKTVQLDEDGSFMIDETTYMASKPVDQRQRLELRVRVTSEQQQLQEFLDFVDKTRTLKNAEFKIERTAKAQAEGAWYVVHAFTINNPV